MCTSWPSIHTRCGSKTDGLGSVWSAIPPSQPNWRSRSTPQPKYVGLLEEQDLIVTERTDAITRDGLKHNGCLPYTIVPVENAINAFHVWQLSALERAAARQQAQRQTEKSGVEFVPSREKSERMATPLCSLVGRGVRQWQCR